MSAKSTRSVKVFSSGAVDARNPRTAAPNDPHRSDCPGPPLAIRSDREPARASAPRLKHCPCLRHIFPANSQTASKSESLLEGITLLAHLQSKAAWALHKDSQAQRTRYANATLKIVTLQKNALAILCVYCSDCASSFGSAIRFQTIFRCASIERRLLRRCHKGI